MYNSRGFALVWVLMFIGVVLGVLVNEVSKLYVEQGAVGRIREDYLDMEEAKFRMDMGVGYLQGVMGRDEGIGYEGVGQGYEIKDLGVRGEGVGLAVNVLEGGMRLDYREGPEERLSSFGEMGGEVRGNEEGVHGLYPVVTGVRFGVRPLLELGQLECELEVRLWNCWDVDLGEREYEFEVERGCGAVPIVFAQYYGKNRRRMGGLMSSRLCNGSNPLIMKVARKLSIGKGEEVFLKGFSLLKSARFYSGVKSADMGKVVEIEAGLDRYFSGLDFRVRSGGELQLLKGIKGIGKCERRVAKGGDYQVGFQCELMTRDVKEFNERATEQDMKLTKAWKTCWLKGGERRMGEGVGGVKYRVGRMCDVDLYNKCYRPGCVFGEVGGVDRLFWDRYRFGGEEEEGMLNINSREVEGWRKLLGGVGLRSWEEGKLAEFFVRNTGGFRSLGEFVESGVMGMGLRDCGIKMRQGELWEGIMRRVSVRSDVFEVRGWGEEHMCVQKIQRKPEILSDALGRRFERTGFRWIEKNM